MIINCNNLTKSFGDKELFHNISFTIDNHEKVALVGNNGVGKTTLLKMIIGEEAYDEGNIYISGDSRLGYLSQHSMIDSDKTIYEEAYNTKKHLVDMEENLHNMEKQMSILSGEELEKLIVDYNSYNEKYIEKGGLTYKKEIISVLTGLGLLDDKERLVNTLSGGQKTRLSLALILLDSPDLLILDEPTNHLDITSVQWLEDYLRAYDKAVLVVSHDRYFLDKIATKVIGIENKAAITYNGNYTDYAKKNKDRYEALLKAYQKNQDEIKHQTEVITKLKQFNREKSIKRAESRQKLLDKMERIDKPVIQDTNMNIFLDYDTESGKDVLDIEHVSMAYDTKEIISDIDLSIKKGEHIALIGDNGTGKSTILKLIMNYISPKKGTITIGANVKIAYYDQEQLNISSSRTLIDEIATEYPDMTNTEIRNMLAAFSFTGDDVFKSCNSLSGGEKGRMSLAKLMLCKANFIILDEPTNHLDNYSKEILENALNDYDGTLLFVSHDRYFINSCAHRIIELKDKKLNTYIGNYDYYLEKKKDEITATQTEIAPSQGKVDYKKQREEQNRLNKLRNRFKVVEEEINQLEEKNKELEELMNTDEVSRNQSKLLKIHEEIQNNNLKLEELMNEWEELGNHI